MFSCFAFTPTLSSLVIWLSSPPSPLPTGFSCLLMNWPWPQIRPWLIEDWKLPKWGGLDMPRHWSWCHSSSLPRSSCWPPSVCWCWPPTFKWPLTGFFWPLGWSSRAVCPSHCSCPSPLWTFRRCPSFWSDCRSVHCQLKLNNTHYNYARSWSLCEHSPVFLILQLSGLWILRRILPLVLFLEI